MEQTFNIIIMKRITEEQAEATPKKLGIHKRFNGKDVHLYSGYEDSKHRYIHVWNRIYRFIEKYINHPWVNCYSDFLKMIKSERILKGSQKDLVWQFKDYFSNFQSSPNYRRYAYFFVNDSGIIIKIKKKPRHDKKVYKEYLYKFNPRRKSEKKYFIQIYGLEYFNKAYSTGVSKEEYEKIYNDQSLSERVRSEEGFTYYSIRGAFTKIPVGKPIEKNKVKQMRKEASSKEKKEERNKQETVYEMKSFATQRERKKTLKRQQQIQAKIEEKLNAIDRDRLGFDEDSFKTPQKFTK